jgi:HEAT repeat protein
VLREQHRNLSVLNSALKVLTGSEFDTVGPLCELLTDSETDIRIYAALALGDLKDQAAIPALIRALQDEDSNVRFHVVEALGKLKAAEAAAELLRIAEAEDIFLAFPAIDALAEMGDRQIATRLAPLLKSDMLRTTVVEALAKLGAEQAVPALAELLGTPGPHVLPVAQALTNVHDDLEKQLGEGSQLVDLVRRHAPAEALQVLIQTLNTTESSRLRPLVRVLGWMQHKAAPQALTGLLGAEEVRKEVVEVLVRYGHDVTKQLIPQIENPDIEVRRAAIVALGRVGDPGAVPSLIRALVTDPDLTIPAALALARIGDSRAYDALVRLLSDDSASVRQAAIAGINSLGDPRTKADTLRMMSDENPNVRESAVRIAGYFAYHVDQIIERVSDAHENVRRAAIETLPFLDDDRVLPVLTRALTQEGSRVRASAAQALGHMDIEQDALRILLAALRDSDAWVRYYAARALARLATPEALDPLANVVQSDATHVRIAAAEAVAAIGGPKAVAVLSPLLSSTDRDLSRAAASAMGSIGHPDALAPLLALLKSSDRDHRLAAVNALGTNPVPEVVSSLEWVAATDGDHEVAAAAVERLARMATPASIESVIRLTAQASVREVCIKALSRVDAENIDIVASGLRHPQLEVRRSLIDALGRRKHPLASLVLTKALEDNDPQVRYAAVVALSRLGSHEAERKLAAMIVNDPDPAVRSAAQKALGK